jgi:hypothetical protein
MSAGLKLTAAVATAATLRDARARTPDSARRHPSRRAPGELSGWPADHRCPELHAG